MEAEKRIDEAILKLHNKGLSYLSIQRMLGVGPNRISCVIHGKQMKHKRGRNPKILPEIKDFINSQTILDARLSNFKMKEMINDKFQVNLCLKSVASSRKKLGFNYRPPMKIQKLTDEQKDLRFQFAQYAQKELIDKVIIFSDESRFGIMPDNRWVHIKKGQWNETALAENPKYMDSVMFWGSYWP